MSPDCPAIPISSPYLGYIQHMAPEKRLQNANRYVIIGLMPEYDIRSGIDLKKKPKRSDARNKKYL